MKRQCEQNRGAYGRNKKTSLSFERREAVTTAHSSTNGTPDWANEGTEIDQVDGEENAREKERPQRRERKRERRKRGMVAGKEDGQMDRKEGRKEEKKEEEK